MDLSRLCPPRPSAPRIGLGVVEQPREPDEVADKHYLAASAPLMKVSSFELGRVSFI
jgi:hypothetical protein